LAVEKIALEHCNSRKILKTMERRVRVGVLGLCGVIKCIIFIMIDSEEE
jgi:hypothetical protein